MVDNNFNKNLENSDEPNDDDLRNEIKKAMSEGDYEDEEYDIENEGCEYAGMLSELVLMPKPFGMTWGREQMEDFLKKRGYKIISRYSEARGSNYPYVLREDDDLIPKNDGKSNIVEVFSDEIRDIILSWLLKIGDDGSKARDTD